MARFEKGKSGNPSGRPKAAAGLRDQLEKRYGNDAKLLLDDLDKLRKSKNEKIRLDALKLLLAYHAGQPTQRLEHGGDGVIVPSAVTIEYTKQPNSDNRT